MLLQPVCKNLFEKHIHGKQPKKQIKTCIFCNLLLQSIHNIPTKHAIICGQSFAWKSVIEQHTRQIKKKKEKMQNCNILLPRFCTWTARKGGTGRLRNARSSGRNYRIWQGFGFDLQNIWALLASNAYEYKNSNMSDIRQHFESVCRYCPAMVTMDFLWMTRLAPLSEVLAQVETWNKTGHQGLAEGWFVTNWFQIRFNYGFIFSGLLAHVNTAKQFF